MANAAYALEGSVKDKACIALINALSIETDDDAAFFPTAMNASHQGTNFTDLQTLMKNFFYAGCCPENTALLYLLSASIIGVLKSTPYFVYDNANSS